MSIIYSQFLLNSIDGDHIMANAFIITFELLDESLLDDLYKEVKFTAIYEKKITLKNNPIGHLPLPSHTLCHRIKNDVSAGDVCFSFIEMLELHMEKQYKLKRVCVVGNDGQCAAADYKETECNVFACPENMFCDF